MNLCTKVGDVIYLHYLKSVTMKIKAPHLLRFIRWNSPQLGGARRTKFLETLERIIPWQDLKSLIGPYYSEGKRGAQPYPLELMIRIHFLQLVYNLSDPNVWGDASRLRSHAAALSVWRWIQNVPMRLRSCVSAICLKKRSGQTSLWLFKQQLTDRGFSSAKER